MVPDAVVVDFARALGVENAGEEMDVDDGPKKMKGFEGVKKQVKALMREGYSALQILSQVSTPSHKIVSSIPSLTLFLAS